MPVYRVPGGPRSGVYSYVDELERWLRSEDETPLQERPGDVFPDMQTTASPVHIEQSTSHPTLASSIVKSDPGKRVSWTLLSYKLALVLTLCTAIVWLVRSGLHSSSQRKSLTTSEGPLVGRSAEARDLYLRARYFWSLRTEEGVSQALELFSQAAERDPHSAAPYAGIADSYILIRQYGHMPDSQAFPRALEASRKALALDPNSFEAHRSYAFVLNYWLWNFSAAEEEFRKVIAIHPDDALAHHWYATSLYSTGRYHDALEQIEIARQLQPESIAILANRDLLLAQVDQESAFTDLLQLEKASPAFPPIHSYLAEIYLSRGEVKQYIDESILTASLSGDRQRSEIVENARKEFVSRGPKETLIDVAHGYGNLADREFPDAMTPASLYARIGEKERSLHYLELACKRRESSFLRLGHDKAFEALTAEGVFQNLLRRRNTPINRDSQPVAPTC